MLHDVSTDFAGFRLGIRQWSRPAENDPMVPELARWLGTAADSSWAQVLKPA
jgi:hypothetical protein